MAATTRSDFGANTEAIDVAKEFASAIRGKTVLVTGVNRGGIGYSTSQAIASQTPAYLIITGRSPSKIQDCIDALKSEYPSVGYRALQADLSTQQSVRDAAKEALSWSDIPAIDVIINNAGVMGVQERILTPDGIEMHFATNHIGHFLLTCLLAPKLIKAADANPEGATRVVNVTSLSPTRSAMRWSDINFEVRNRDLPDAEQPSYEMLKAWGYANAEDVKYVPLEGYNQSKVANVLFSIGLSKRLYPKVASMAVHPGVIMTELGRNFPPETLEAIKSMNKAGTFSFKTLGAGASTSLVAAFDPNLAMSTGESKNGSENWGSYLIDCQISGQAHPLAVSSTEAEKLWTLSEQLVHEKFSW